MESEYKLRIEELQQRVFDNKKKLTSRDMKIQELESKVCMIDIHEVQHLVVDTIDKYETDEESDWGAKTEGKMPHYMFVSPQYA